LQVDVRDLVAANPQILDPAQLKVGQDIYLPVYKASAPKPKPVPVANNRPEPANQNPAPKGDPVTAGIRKADLKQTDSLPADEKNVFHFYGEEALRAYQLFKAKTAAAQREVAEAHRVYQSTGKIPQTKIPLSPIEIKEGRLM